MLWSISEPTGRVDADAARRNFLVAGYAIECCTFAATIWSEKAENLARVGLQIDTLDCMYILASLEDSGEESRMITLRDVSMVRASHDRTARLTSY